MTPRMTPRMTGATPLLRVQGLTKSYGGIQAVRNVSFSVDVGEMLALIGPNGAGKSTCFAMLYGQIRPDAGSFHLLGQDITRLPPQNIWRLGVGRTFQITATFPSMTVRQNVQVALLSHHRQLSVVHRFAGRSHVAEADALLALVGMGAPPPSAPAASWPMAISSASSSRSRSRTSPSSC